MATSGLTQPMKELHLHDCEIVNDVIFFLQKNHKVSSDEEIIKVCKDSFPETEIYDAKQVLHDECLEHIKNYDAKVADRIIKTRKGERKLQSVLADIIKGIDVLEACSCDVSFGAKDVARIPEFTAEETTLISVMSKLISIEKRLASAEEEIDNLKTKNEELENENKELRDENRKSKSSSSSVMDASGTSVGEGSGAAATSDPRSPQGQAPATAAASDKSQHLHRSKLTSQQKYVKNQVYLESALEAVATAVENGTPVLDAICIGKTKGEEVANSYAQKTKQQNSTMRQGTTAATGNGRTGNTGASGPATQADEFPVLQRATNRSKLSKIAPYKRGNSDNATGKAVIQKPRYMENKCLVIRGLRKDLEKDECLQYIKDTAKREINVLHMACLSRKYSPWLTIAIELDTEDYNILSDINIWENHISIREFVGWRFWRGDRPKRLTAGDIKKSVRMSWNSDGRPN